MEVPVIKRREYTVNMAGNGSYKLNMAGREDKGMALIR